jgi:signal peptidase I
MDVVCPECGKQYRADASAENKDNAFAKLEVSATTCPICRYRMELDKDSDYNERSFGGDRIIVSKLAYVFDQPQRWDVFVFKYPGNPKINYIKRLVGLPGETFKIRHGDLHIQVSAAGPQNPHIARKPPDKVLAMLQLVDDSHHIAEDLQKSGWPSRWRPLNQDGEAWQTENDSRAQVHQIKPTASTAWLAYRHMVPRDRDWRAIVENKPLDLSGYQGQLITDYYEYNDSVTRMAGDPSQTLSYGNSDAFNWVGDLAVEARVEVLSDTGELLLDLVEGGIHHRCAIDVASGRATLTLDDGQRGFRDESGQESREVTGQTGVRGRGNYELRFSNVDDQLLLWVNDTLVTFSGPTTFASPHDLSPKWSVQDPGDFNPIRIGARQAEVRVDRLRVFRDVYYIAAKIGEGSTDSDYNLFWAANSDGIVEVLSNPHSWSTTDLFASRREVTFSLGADQFFPMGDNSPQSKDGRLWSQNTRDGLIPPPYVEREMLIGKAVFIYWPHGWRIFTDFVGIIPNYQRMGRIK